MKHRTQASKRKDHESIKERNNDLPELRFDFQILLAKNLVCSVNSEQIPSYNIGLYNVALRSFIHIYMFAGLTAGPIWLTENPG